MQFTQRSVQCISPSGLHRMAYTEWGERDNPRVLLCVHGLTRNARDFDRLAEAMSSHYRVICPDVVGRGRSGRLRNPAGYGIPQYAADMVTLIARLNVETVDWVGTSMGGLIGMALASQEGSPIRKLLLNDVGPVITVESLKRIGSYVGTDPTWAGFDEALAFVKAISAPFGALSEAQWYALTESSVAQRADGRWGFVYDPQIAAPFKAAFGDQDIDLWPVYEQIVCPTLVLRGADSDLLTRETWQAMGLRGPRARLAEIQGVGHAPMFMTEEQISIARDFLLSV
ncbi:alpha/beta hydrolase [Dechloromonas denitrificans]|jgi:pimeloyl-ACP methyl ester carboxylesterase|uniref:alpha/beta fold hydrolase n=1 Tax=Dechloromonas denitrificans TaxID=281362 RepID=UPI001CF81928|nr:alpha/beta hydrolase [Dechloromonas denitrificans]UCV12880.1 alpha/beta hydrolase [Dechloromonas denitrificans]